MPITSSATRALRVSKRRQAHNLSRVRTMENAIRAFRDAALGGKEAKEAARLAYQAIDKAAKRGVIKKAAAARKKSQVAKLLSPKKK